jgi:hypothetical protein
MAQTQNVEKEVDRVVRDYLRGRVTMGQAVERLPKDERSFLTYVMRVFLPEELFRRWTELRNARSHGIASSR